MSPDDLWVLGFRANDATGCRPRWVLISFRQRVADLGAFEPITEAMHRAGLGLTLPEDPEQGETHAELVERLSGPEGEEWLLFGPWGRPAAGRQNVGELEWDRISGFFPEAERQRMLNRAVAHTYILAL